MFLRERDDSPALIDAATGALYTYADVATRVRDVAARLGGDGGLVAIFADNSLHTVIHYLAALQRGLAVAFVDPELRSDHATRLLQAYRPDMVIYPVTRRPDLPRRYRTVEQGLARSMDPVEPVHADLAILLTTSGSTGSAKMVRLSRRNVLANAAAIGESLDLTHADRAMTTLPLHYSFGLSILNSHLLSGAGVVVGPADLLAPAFWQCLAEHHVTSFAGVPFAYQTLRRLGFDAWDAPTLTTMTQAGGRLDEQTVDYFSDLMRARNGRFFVMYGQTEASPRMACFAASHRPDKRGSVGPALPGGQFVVRGDAGESVAPGTVGDIFYQGPNVMMGYAQCRADLALGDGTGDTLDTGDIGFLDEDGYLHITGRTKRIAKIAGVRISLDEVERLLDRHGPVGVVELPTQQLGVYCAWGDDDALVAARQQICRDLKIPPGTVRFTRVDALPTLANGKPDYRRLVQSGRSPA
jgi:acyl-CoA synthetase (AMP-forming)/AMP-acid ligase II